MREIEFRGKGYYEGSDKDEWAYGFCEDTFTMHYRGEEYYIDPRTIGQYIGHKDVTGQNIYEGDVLDVLTHFSSHEHHTGVVQYSLNKAGFVILDEHNEFVTWDWVKGQAKIIGNIFDNPELKEKYWKFWDRRYDQCI